MTAGQCGKWLASQRRNRNGHYTVHYQMPGEVALCGKSFIHAKPATLNNEPYDINNLDTCKGCKGKFILFFMKGKTPVSCTEGTE